VKFTKTTKHSLGAATTSCTVQVEIPDSASADEIRRALSAIDLLQEAPDEAKAREAIQ
jgi:hypothetical protein